MLICSMCRSLMRRVLADLHAAGLLEYDTLEVWQYDNSDAGTKGKVSLSCYAAPICLKGYS